MANFRLGGCLTAGPETISQYQGKYNYYFNLSRIQDFPKNPPHLSGDVEGWDYGRGGMKEQMV